MVYEMHIGKGNDVEEINNLIRFETVESFESIQAPSVPAHNPFPHSPPQSLVSSHWTSKTSLSLIF